MFSWQPPCISLLHLTSVTYNYYLTYHIKNSQIASQLYRKQSSSTKSDVSLLCSKLRVNARVLTMESKVPGRLLHPMSPVQAHIKLLCLTLTPLQPHRPPGCFLSISDTHLPQGLCTDCSLCLDHFLPQKSSWMSPSPLSNLYTNVGFSVGLTLNTLLKTVICPSHLHPPYSTLFLFIFHFHLSLCSIQNNVFLYSGSYTWLSFSDSRQALLAHGSSSVLFIRTAWDAVGAHKDLLNGWMNGITLNLQFSWRDYNSTAFNKHNDKLGSRC